MNIIKLFTIILILLHATSGFADEAKNYDCLDERNKIIQRISEVPTCTQDKDCQYFDYGYPWQMGICLKAVLSTSEEGKNLTNLNLIEQYNKECIYNNKERSTEYKNFQEKLASTKCKNLVRTYCLKGLCRTQGFVLYDQPDAVIREPSSEDVDMKEYLKNLK